MKKSSAKGFTIIELMLTIAVAGVLLTIGVPSMRTMVANNRITTVTNNFIVDANLARSEAIKRNASVYISARNPTAGNEYGGGWWITTDNTVPPAAAEIIKIGNAIDGAITLSVGGGLTQLEYLANGTGNGAAAAVVTVCDNRTGETGRRITLNAIGRIELDRNFICP